MASFEFKAKDEPPEVSYPADKGSYSYMRFGLKYHLLNIDEKKWSPWLSLEWSIHRLGFSNYVYHVDGECFAPAIGLDLRVNRWFILSAGARRCSFKGTSNYQYQSNFETTMYTLDAVFRFRIY